VPSRLAVVFVFGLLVADCMRGAERAGQSRGWRTSCIVASLGRIARSYSLNSPSGNVVREPIVYVTS
jgi:hypothetical protein